MMKYKYHLWIFIMVSISNCISVAQGINPILKNLTTNDGLSFNTIHTINQDSRGFIWIGTWDGVDRYDGIEMKNYRTYYKRLLNHVQIALEDTTGNLWFGGTNLVRYTARYDKQKVLWIKENDNLYHAHGITDLALGPDNNMYALRLDSLYTFNPYSEDTIIHKLFMKNEAYLPKEITAIKFCKKGNLWLATDEGMFVYHSDKKEITKFSKLKYPDLDYVHDFLFDKDGNLWVVFTYHLTKYDFSKNLTTNYQVTSHNSPVLTTIFESGNGCIWIGTYENGLYFLDDKQTTFNCLLNHSDITCIFEDDSHRLWIGTGNAGVFVYDSLRNNFAKLPIKINNKPLESFHASRIINNNDKGLYFISRNYGLMYFNINTQKTRILDPLNDQSEVLFRDMEGNIWYDHLKFLVKYNPDRNQMNRIKHPVPHPLPVLNAGNKLTYITRYSNQLIVASDYGHVYSFNPDINKFRLIYKNPSHPVRTLIVKGHKLLIAVYGLGVLVMNEDFHIMDTIQQEKPWDGIFFYSIMAEHNDAFDTLWLGGIGGLSYLDFSDKKIHNKFVFQENSNIVTSILEDENNNLWLGSSRGIYKYDRAKQQLLLFNANHGLPPGRLFIHSAVKTSNGHMYFGGNNGIVHFDPAEVERNQKAPPVVLTGFIVNNSSQRNKKKKQRILQEDINYIEKLHLNHKQNSLTIKYAALNYTSPQHNQYKYKLVGLDNDWKLAGNQSQAHYTNLDGGDYIFQVMGSNNDGVWNENPRMLFITIDPPPWKTWWAYMLYAAALLAVFLTFYIYNVKRIRLQHNLELKQKESESLQKIDEAKTHFFTNISHEFRTPLSLIIDPANRLLQDGSISPRQKNIIQVIENSGKKLLFLVNQILDLAKSKNSQLTIGVEEIDLISFIKPIFQLFISQSESIHLNYKIILPDTPVTFWTDTEKMEKILLNLLSNAFKFCTNGEIKVEVTDELHTVVIAIEDTGVGIPPPYLEKIFDPYFQINPTGEKRLAGSGIGLSLVKQYVNLLHGQIEVESQLNVGTKFYLTFPKGNKHFTKKVIKPAEKNTDYASPNEQSKVFLAETGKKQMNLEKNYSVLLIEDNHTMMTYLEDALSEKFNVLKASNGITGFEKTLQKHPDIVISDIMMPLMDGYMYCEKVKQDTRISHIPVILLTARILHQDKIKGLCLGADDYIVKPFHLDELILRITYHISKKEQIRNKFLNDFRFKSEKEFLTSIHDQFLNIVFSQIESNLHDDQFGVEKLSELMNMSRIHLYRKIKSLTDQTPTELIRNFRLRKAGLKLSTNASTVTQVCYEVGFNNPSYFSKCFHKFYGKHPSEYKKQFS